MDTIFALSSGGLPAGVAIIRVSGPRAGDALSTLAGALPEPRHAAYRAIRDPQDGRLVDRGLVLWFPSPASETGEDMAEFQLHGSVAVVDAIIGLLKALPDTRPAQPGEFARRAFINGKLDLSQVEGLADLVSAETESQLDQALMGTEGALRRACEGWREEILALRSAVEARLDFADEGDVGPLPASVAEASHAIARSIRQACDGYGASELVRRGFRVAITGLPNAGKSSLLNAIAGREVAIVTAEAGTTRDVLEVPVDLGGLKVVFHDTAGIRDAESEAEREGVRRARQAAADCDLALWLDDLSEAPGQAVSVAAPRTPAPEGSVAETWSIGTKADLVKGPLRLTPAVSARTGDGLDTLLCRVRDRAAKAAADRGPVARSRQRDALRRAGAALDDVADGMEAEIVAELLRSAGDAVGEVVGRVGPDDVLERIFADFCIGK